MKIKEFFNKAKDCFKQFWDWVRISPRNAIIATITLLAVVAGLILFIKFVLPAILAIACVIFVLFGEDIANYLSSKPVPPPLTLENDTVCWECTKFLFDSFSSSHEILREFVNMPETVNDIYNLANYLGAYNNAPMLSIHLLRKQRDISDDDCNYIKNALQRKVDSRLRDGHLFGYIWAVPAVCDVPLLKIVSVERSEIYLHIGILLTNTPASVQAARLSDRPTPPPCVDDIDPLFNSD